jgi:hypothetical protein
MRFNSLSNLLYVLIHQIYDQVYSGSLEVSFILIVGEVSKEMHLLMENQEGCFLRICILQIELFYLLTSN